MENQLSKTDFKQLEGLIGNGRKTFRLLYSIARDGCAATTFHQKCDQKGPTVTVLFNAQRSVYGGYTSMSWQGAASNYIMDTDAFLFKLYYNGNLEPKRFNQKKPANSIYCHSNYGPTFGAGHDLCTFTGSISRNGNVFTRNVDFTLDNTFDMQSVDANGFANGSLEVTDLQVYSVVDDPTPALTDEALLEAPWKVTVDWDSPNEVLHDLKGEVESYVPVHEIVQNEARLPHANILFLGPVGAGKSSFFNTINSVFRGQVFNQARSGRTLTSLTTKFTKYPVLSSVTRKPLNFRLCDTRGLEANHLMSTENVRFMLQGNLPNKFQFDPSGTISMDSPGFKKFPKLEDQMHLVVFFIDATLVEAMPDLIPEVLQNIKDLQNTMNAMDIPQLVVLTKVDNVCKHVKDDVSTIFRSPVVEHCVNKVAEDLGLPRNCILPMKNYEKEGELDVSVNIVALFTLREILRNADAFLFNQIDEIYEQYSVKNLSVKD